MLISTVTGRVLGRKVDVVRMSCDSALGELRSGKVDAIITVDPISADDVVCGALGTIGSCVLIDASHPLASKETVTLEDLAPYPVLDPASAFSHFHDSVLEPYIAHGLQSEPYVVDSLNMGIEFFTRRLGFSFMVGGNITGPAEGLIMRPIASSDALAIPICLTTLKSSRSTDYVEFRRALSRLSLFS